MEYEDLEYILHFWDGDYHRRPPNEDDWEICIKFVKFFIMPQKGFQIPFMRHQMLSLMRYI